MSTDKAGRFIGIASVAGIFLTGCGDWIAAHSPAADIAYEIKHTAAELWLQQAGASAVVRHPLSVDSTTVIIVAPGGALTLREIRKTAAPFIEAIDRVAPDFGGRPFLTLSTLDRAESAVLEGVTVPAQLFVIRYPGRGEVVVTLRKLDEHVVVEKLH